MMGRRFRAGWGRSLLAAGRLSPTQRYAIALVTFALGLLARFILAPLLLTTVPYVTFFPSVAASAWYGGLGPGILTTVLSAVSALFFFVQPVHSFRISTVADLVRTAAQPCNGFGKSTPGKPSTIPDHNRRGYRRHYQHG